jgi:hypothetical protein
VGLPVLLELWRAAAGLTGVQASRVFDVPVLTWYRWIGGTEPNPKHAVQLRKVLDAACQRSRPRQDLPVVRSRAKTVLR